REAQTSTQATKRGDEMSKTEREPMTRGFAVFNCHLNNAKAKAKRRFKKKFGAEVWKLEIQPFLNKGIMSIFEQEPNDHTLWYVDEITAIVNARRQKTEVSQ